MSRFERRVDALLVPLKDDLERLGSRVIAEVDDAYHRGYDDGAANVRDAVEGRPSPAVLHSNVSKALTKLVDAHDHAGAFASDPLERARHEGAKTALRQLLESRSFFALLTRSTSL